MRYINSLLLTYLFTLASRLGLVSAGEVNVSVSGGERLGLVSVSSFYVPILGIPLHIAVSCITIGCCLTKYKMH